jgi:hypothetical protein
MAFANNQERIEFAVTFPVDADGLPPTNADGEAVKAYAEALKIFGVEFDFAAYSAKCESQTENTCEETLGESEKDAVSGRGLGYNSVASIGLVTDVYNNATRCQITRRWVNHPDLANVSRSLRALVQSLASEVEEEFWRHTLGPLRKLAFAFCSVPIPFTQAAHATAIDWEKVQRQVRLCEQLFPDSHKPLSNLAQSIQKLSAENGSPLIGPIEELLQHSGSLSVMIRNPRMNQAVETYFNGNPAFANAKVVSPSQLRGAQLCDTLIAIGPCAWFPEYVFTAPRAGAIHVISYRWIADNWKPGPILLHRPEALRGQNCHHRIGTMPRVNVASVATDHTLSDIQPADILPPLPGFAVGANHSSQTGANHETILARLCHLCGNRAVFVGADEGATSLIIDTSDMGIASVRRAPSEQLEPGHYLLLRTSGGGDLIAPLADRVLGDSAVKRRSQQAEWKQKLSARACERFGALSRRELSSKIAAELRLEHLSNARPANVHYWMSAKCISPRKVDDFLAIMTFAGLKERTDELWSAMEEIDRAHKRAGFFIRRMLLQKIADTSLEPLERDGEMVFDLGDQDGGTLSAFQIIGIQPEEVEVPTDRIGVLLDGEE